MINQQPEETQTQINGCPYHESPQITNIPIIKSEKGVELDDDGMWHIYSFNAARVILRSGAVNQAGFQAELMSGMNLGKKPLLHLDGPEHLKLRKATAKYFTPKAVSAYEGMIADYVDDMLAELKTNGKADISDLSLKLAVRVAAKVVGMTNSNVDGMSKRLNAFFELDPAGIGNEFSFKALYQIVIAQIYTWRLLLWDVLPAIRARKANPQEDLITHLIGLEYSNIQILTECLMFGAAGMVTTREFISAAALHFLTNDQLRQDYLAADHTARHEMLHEILRLEPVVSNLYRRSTTTIDLEVDGKKVRIPEGALLKLYIYKANMDESVFGDPTDVVCPHRDLPKSVLSPGLSFGDGAHRCPGAYIAIEESDIFLTRLLKLDNLKIIEKPPVKFNPMVEGYELHNFIVGID